MVRLEAMADLKLLQNRDPKELAVVFKEINPVLIKVLASNAVHGEHAEELVQQTWETFFTNLDKFEGRSALQTFVVGILINKIREHRRAQNKFVAFEDGPEAMDAFMAQHFTSDGHWANRVPDPSERLMNAEVGRSIEGCLEGLSADQRTAFLLKELEQKETPEICNVLGVSASNLRVLIFRAKDKLRKCLEGIG